MGMNNEIISHTHKYVYDYYVTKINLCILIDKKVLK